MSVTSKSPSSERVIITGSTSGLGLDMARRFLAEGARVVLHGRDPDKLARVRASLDAAPDRLAAVAGHVGDPATAHQLAATAERAFGGVDVLINNAGIFLAKPFLDSSVDELEALFATNVKGTFLVSQAVIPLLIANGGGSIINVGTVLVDQPIHKIPSTVAMMSKGGVHAFTRSLAVELAPHKIRVNAIAPGIIRTPLTGDNADQLASIHPLGRIGEPHEISDAAIYLARASYVTGTILDVDGGYAHGR